MSLDYYLIQYMPDMRRHETFNVGVIVKIDDDIEMRFLSDSQWLERFGPGGKRYAQPHIEGKFNNWKSWRTYYERIIPVRSLEDLLADQDAIPHTHYALIHMGRRVLGSNLDEIEIETQAQFDLLVL